LFSTPGNTAAKSQALSDFMHGQDFMESALEFSNPGFAVEALNGFERAFLVAVLALQNPPRSMAEAEAAQQPTLPFQIVLITEFFSTKRGRNPEIVALVMGAGNQLQDLTVSRLPQGVQAEVERINPDAPVFLIKLSIADNTRPGRYSLQVTARRSAGNPRQATKDLSLIVN